MSTGIITAGVAVAFWPAAPVFLLRKGGDITIDRGVSFEVYTDADHTVENRVGAAMVNLANQPAAAVRAPGSGATVSIASPVAGADIEVDGVFVGSTPTTITLAVGEHRVLVRHGLKSWQRTLRVSEGGSITLNAIPQ